MSEAKVFKFERFGVLVVGLILFGTVPLLSLIDLISDGSIDLSAVSSGRRSWPRWLNYLLGWMCFVWFSHSFGIPALKYILRGNVFILKGDEIQIGATVIKRDDIEIRRWSYRGLRLQTATAPTYFHPAFSKEGIAAINSFFGDQ